jgi:glycosyltransferase involved in cell wall biosynthesis
MLITTSYPTTGDGREAAGAFVYDFAMELSKSVKVDVVAPNYSFSHETINENLNVHRFYVPKLPLSTLAVTNPNDLVSILKTLHSGAEQVKKLAVSQKIDHILALWTYPSGFWARQIFKKHKINYSVWALGSDIWSLGKVPLIKNSLAQIIQDAHSVFADGHALKADVEQLSLKNCLFMPSARALPIPETKKISIAPKYKLTYVGRWHKNKGVDILLDCLTFLRDQDWNKISRITIAGGGPLERFVSNRGAALKKLGRPVEIIGYQNTEQLISLLTDSDFILIPSRIESIPVIFSDAVKHHCPVICSPVGDLPRLLAAYKCGIMASEVSPEGFAGAIQNALDVAPSNFTDATSSAAQDFDLKKIVNTFLDHTVTDANA